MSWTVTATGRLISFTCAHFHTFCASLCKLVAVILSVCAESGRSPCASSCELNCCDRLPCAGTLAEVECWAVCRSLLALPLLTAKGRLSLSMLVCNFASCCSRLKRFLVPSSGSSSAFITCEDTTDFTLTLQFNFRNT